ncbi:MAG: acetylglutamate kinase [Candidatus Saganbacteria bacterium]|nr:acetylglutamate kinase [Candidatus Saganbacteria bacterium]
MFNKLIKRANIVIEALPYLQEFHGKVIVIKYGGSAMHDPELKDIVLRNVVFLKLVGMHPVIVHGGGPDISRALKRKKIKTEFIQGLRVTTKDIMKVVESVLGKKINQQIVSLIKKNGGKAKGFYGKKGRVIKAKKQWVKDEEGKYVDLGFTGHVAGIRYRFLQKWMKKGYIPVLSPIGVGRRGKTYNINADSAAAKVATFLKAAKLILLTDVRGVQGKDGKLLSKINTYKTRKLIKQGVISGGMIPKVKCGLYAIRNGVEKVHIIDGQIPHALLLELFTDRGIGTMVVR